MDIKTLILSLSLGNLVFGVMLILYQLREKRSQGNPYWTAAKFLQFTGWILLYCRTSMPDFWTLTVANACLLSGFVYECCAMFRISGRRVKRTLHVFSVVATVLACCIFTPLPPPLRIAVASFISVIIFALSGWTMLSSPGNKSLLRTYIGWSMWLLAVVLAVRGMLALFVPEGFVLFTANTIQNVTFSMLYYTMLTNGFGLLLLTKETADRGSKQIELALRASEEKFATAFRATPDAINITRLNDGVYLEVNEGFTAITGYTSEDVVGRSSLALDIWVNPDDRAYLVSELKEQGVVNNLEAQFRRKDGSILTGFMSARIIEVNGEPCLLSVSRDISERKRMEDLLRESESREKERAKELSIIVESVPTPILIADGTDGRRITGNRAACELFKIPAEANFSKRATDGTGPAHYTILHDDVEIQPHDLPLQRALLGERIKDYLMDVLFDDGTRYTLFCNATPLRDEQGTVRGAVAAYLDLTTHIRTAKELQDSEGRYRTLFDESPFGVVLVDPDDFKVLHFNSAACKNLGYEPDEFSRLRVMDFAVTEDRQEIEMRSEEVLHHGGVMFETIHRTKQGELRDVMVNLKTITVAGKPMIQSIISDITESKRSRQLMELYLYALDNAKDQIFMNGRNSRFIYVNQAACNALGYSRDELLDMGVGDIDPNFPSEVWDDHWQELKLHDGLRLETFHRKKDGGTYPVEMSLKPFVFDRAEYILAVARDLTKRKQQEAEKLEMERRLLHSQKLESLGVLAGGIAHDFNNLLAAIMGNLDLGLLRLPVESPVRWNVEQAIKASRRAADLTGQMLAYSGKGSIENRAIDLGELVLHNAELLRTSIPRSISMITEAFPGNSLIVGDPGQIQQVIMNLITNAAEAIDQGHGLITITTSSGDYSAVDLSKSLLEEKPAPGRFSWLEVADNGCGMDGETRRRVFEPFFTTKFTGRGLGMAAVLGIIRAHQGAIFVDSVIAEGSRFRVLFPAAAPARCAGTNINTSSYRMEAGSSVLVVDDEEMIQNFCCACIENLGFKALPAPDGLAAMELFKEHADVIHLVILDLTMPRMDGVTTFNELKKIKPEVKIIVSSGYGEENVDSRFADKKPDAFIQKPYAVQALNDVIRKVLARTE